MKLLVACLIPLLWWFVLPATAQVSGTGTTNYIPIWTDSNAIEDSVIFESDGKVGIGTTTPAASLNVIGQNGGIYATAPPVLQVTGGSSGIGGGPIQLTAGPGQRRCVCNSPGGTGGLIGINGGAGGPGFVLGGRGGPVKIVAGAGGTIASGATGGSGGSIQVTAGTGASWLSGASHGGSGGSITLQPGVGGRGTASSGSTGSVVLAPSGGRVGVGTLSPTATMDVVAGGTTLADEWTTRSSRRFKTNIQPLEGALEKIEQLQGVSYARKVDGKREIGVVAEDVDRVIPEVVSRDPETNDVQGVDYSRLAALLIEAVKAQQTEIQHLKVQIEKMTPSPTRHSSR